MAIPRHSIRSDVNALPLPTLTLASYGGKGIGVRSLTYLGARTRIMSLKGWCGGDAKTNDASLQIDSDLFLESSSPIDDYLNHSCVPNSSIEWNNLVLSTSREVLPGEEITIDYNMCEFDMTALQKDHSFGCRCRSADCVKVVKGFKHLTVEQKLARRRGLSPYLQKMLWLELGDLRGGKSADRSTRWLCTDLLHSESHLLRKTRRGALGQPYLASPSLLARDAGAFPSSRRRWAI